MCRQKMASGLELYLHIPFCRRKCRYCDFLSFPCGREEMERYLTALEQEIEETGACVSEPVDTIFFGGGTPSLLTPRQMERLMEAIRKAFHLAADCEISMESNPGTLDYEKLSGYRSLGINRLSMGLQSADAGLLARLGRIHSYEDFLRNYHWAREAGFDNINVDLMSGLPGQTLALYEDTLSKLIHLKPEHISAYSLILEEGTPFYEDPTILRDLPEEETERQMYALTLSRLSEGGYHRYEISNYALPGYECRHNKGYWKLIPYLGMGLGAASYYDFARFSNTTDMDSYLEKPFIPFSERREYHINEPCERMEDRMILGLRMMEGVSEEEFLAAYGKSMMEVYGEVIRTYIASKHLILEDGRLRLSEEGINVSNRIFVDLLS